MYPIASNIVVTWIERWFFLNRFYVSVSALINIWSVSLILGNTLNIWDLIIVALVTTGIYQWNRLSDNEEDSINSAQEAQIATQFHEKIRFYCLIVFSLSVILSIITGGLVSLAFVVGGITLGFLYNQPLFLGIRITRLKNIFFVKNIASAFGLTVGLVIFPSLHSAHISNNEFIFLFVYVFMNLIMLGLIGDIRDYQGDQATLISTLPTVLGIEKTKVVIHIVNSFSSLLIVLAVLLNYVPIIWLLLMVVNLTIYFWTRFISDKVATKRIWSHLLILLDTFLALSFGLIMNAFRNH